MREPVDDWVAFVQTHGGECFRGWPADLIRLWFCWHAEQRTIEVVAGPQGVRGLAVGWQCAAADLEQHWQTNNPAGDCFYFAQLVAVDPGAVAALLARFERKWPHWEQLDLRCRRGPKGWQRMKPKYLRRLAKLVTSKL